MGRETIKAAKSLAKEQILGKNEKITAKSGNSMVEKARDLRRRRFEEAKKKLALKASKDDDDLMESIKVKEEMLNPATKLSMADADPLDSSDDESKKGMEFETEEDERDRAIVPNEIRMDGEEHTSDREAESAEAYAARIEREEHELELDKASYTEDEWDKLKAETAEEQRRQKAREEDQKRQEQQEHTASGVNDNQLNGESSEERSGGDGVNIAREDYELTEDEGSTNDDQSIESLKGASGANEVKEVIELDSDNDTNEGADQENVNDDNNNEGKENEQEETPVGADNNNDNEEKSEEPPKVSFADIARGKKQQQLGAKLNYEHTCRFEISAFVSGMPDNPTDDQTAAMLKDMIASLLKRFKNITKRVAIQPWYNTSLLPSIEKVDGISEDVNVLKDYITHEGSRNRRFRNGRNSRLLVNVTFGKVAGGGDEIQHLWQQQTKERHLQSLMSITLKVACMQAESYYPIGAFINSSEKQVVKQLEEGLTELLGASIAIAYRDIPAEYRTIENFWTKAKDRAGRGNIRGSYSYAPQALTVYTNTRSGSGRIHLIKEMMKRYGKMTTEGQYPTLPDGSRMRFIPPESMAPTSQRHKVRDSIKRQIDLRSVTTVIDMEYAFDIEKKVDSGPHKGKSLGSLVLALSSADNKYGGVPFFKHFVHKWAMDYRYKGLSVAVFTNMASIATEIMGSLQGVMEKTYGKEVGEEIRTFRGGATLTSEGDLNSDLFQIQLDDDDWFEKTGSFVLTGIFKENNVNETEQPGVAAPLEPVIKLPSGVDILMETHSIITMHSFESNATLQLAGAVGSNQGGLPAGRANTSNEAASSLARAALELREKEKDEAEQKEPEQQGEENEPQSEDKQKLSEAPKPPTQQPGAEPKQSEEVQTQQQQKPMQQEQHQGNSTNSNVDVIPGTPPKQRRGRSDDRTGRGRSGGRGNYDDYKDGGRGRGRGENSIRPSIISPNGKKAGSTGGSGPSKASTSETPSEEWSNVGTKEDERKLLEQIKEQTKKTTGATGEGKQP